MANPRRLLLARYRLFLGVLKHTQLGGRSRAHILKRYARGRRSALCGLGIGKRADVVFKQIPVAGRRGVCERCREEYLFFYRRERGRPGRGRAGHKGVPR